MVLRGPKSKKNSLVDYFIINMTFLESPRRVDSENRKKNFHVDYFLFNDNHMKKPADYFIINMVGNASSRRYKK